MSQWMPGVLAGQDDILLGPWASAPISEDFTFGLELELVLSCCARSPKGAVWMAHSIWLYSSMRGPHASASIMDYLLRMGISEGWR
jgi:hypothetical protein